MKVGIFTIIKNEHLYLDEWLQYHLNKNLGIDVIYVFDDPFSKPHEEICNKYDSNRVINKSALSLFDKETQNKILNRLDYKNADQPRQIRYMYATLNYLKKNTKLDWVFYIDVDEFIILANEKESVHNLLKNYQSYEILVVSWMNFGANGHLYKPEGSVIDNYTTQCKLNVGLKMSPKANSKCCFNLHKWNADKIKTNHHIPIEAKWCKSNFSTLPLDVVYDKIYIRHYITKSLDEYLYKLFIRGQFFGSKSLNTFFYFNLDIKREDPKVQKVINKYRDMYYSGELKFSLF